MKFFRDTAIEDSVMLDKLISIINSGGTYAANAEEVAAAWAVDSMDEAGYGFSLPNAEAHLEILQFHGARFREDEALQLIADNEKEVKEYMGE